MPIVGRIQRKPKTLYYVDAEGLIHETKKKAAGKRPKPKAHRAETPPQTSHAAYEHNETWIVLSTHDSKGAATRAAKSAAAPRGYALVGAVKKDNQWQWDVVARPVASPPSEPRNRWVIVPR